jgi:hypothetical protein
MGVRVDVNDLHTNIPPLPPSPSKLEPDVHPKAGHNCMARLPRAPPRPQQTKEKQGKPCSQALFVGEALSTNSFPPTASPFPPLSP